MRRNETLLLFSCIENTPGKDLNWEIDTVVTTSFLQNILQLCLVSCYCLSCLAFDGNKLWFLADLV